MKKTPIIANLIVLASLALVGCDTNEPVSPAPITSPDSIVGEPAPVLEENIPPVVEESAPAVEEAPVAGDLDNTDAAGLGKTIESYNQEVDASNDKAREVIDSYNSRIDSATGN